MPEMKCPDCNSAFLPGSTTCNSCGWGKKRSKSTSYDDNSRKGLCEWGNNGRECPATGTNSTSTTGGGQWYCLAHFSSSGASEGHAVIDDYERDGLPDRRTPSQSSFDGLVNNQNNYQQLDESESDYRKRASNGMCKIKKSIPKDRARVNQKTARQMINKTDAMEIYQEKMGMLMDQDVSAEEAGRMALETVLNELVSAN